MHRLTEAQWRELRELAGRDYGSQYADDYRPIMRLLELGLVDQGTGRFGGSTYRITDAGRHALQDEEG